MKAWMRHLEVILSNEENTQRYVFGNNEHDDLAISVEGHKYLAALADTFTVRISNLTYNEMLRIIEGKYFNVEIKCGYKSANTFTIFRGGVLYISNMLIDKRTNEVVILCANKLVAVYGQARLNLTLQSGINMYSALKYVCRAAGIQNSNISHEFKEHILNETVNVNQSIGSFLDIFTQSNNCVVQGDSSFGNDVSIWNPLKTDNRYFKLNSDNVILSGGYPTLTTEGLRITLLPTMNFMPGDVIELDNSIINIGSTTQSEAFRNKAYFMDRSGQYIIYQIDIQLNNRESEFSYQILCKSKSRMIQAFGGDK